MSLSTGERLCLPSDDVDLKELKALEPGDTVSVLRTDSLGYRVIRDPE